MRRENGGPGGPADDDDQLLADLRHAGELVAARGQKERDVFLIGLGGLLRVAANRIDELRR